MILRIIVIFHFFLFYSVIFCCFYTNTHIYIVIVEVSILGYILFLASLYLYKKVSTDNIVCFGNFINKLIVIGSRKFFIRSRCYLYHLYIFPWKFYMFMTMHLVSILC